MRGVSAVASERAMDGVESCAEVGSARMTLLWNEEKLVHELCPVEVVHGL